MKISIITLFPEMFAGPFDYSIVKRAQEDGKVSIDYLNIRDFGIGKHKQVDDTPYGGGIGMVMRVDVMHAAIIHAKETFAQQWQNRQNGKPAKQITVLLSARGEQFRQSLADTYAKLDHLILICGHYEGVDDRISAFIDEEVSIGDFVLTGGELPAMLITDTVTRLITGVLKEGATEHETFTYTHEEQSLVEYPHYTKPQEYNGLSVPDVLLSGNHKHIESWRKEEAIKKTKKVRPDLLR
jgi:tRNA (guanine37-N1)-methyltransferase